MVKLFIGTSKQSRCIFVDVDLDRLSAHRSFWETSNTDTLPSAVVDILFAIFQRPYEDRNDWMSCYRYEGQLIYRTNHDALNATRKVAYMHLYIELLARYGKSSVSPLLQSLTLEERVAINLLVFLERAGRVDESPSSHDRDLMSRSMLLFAPIAGALGIKASLICALQSLTIEHRVSPTVVEGFELPGRTSEDSASIPRVILDLLTLAHRTDLLRCRPDSSVKGWICRGLDALVSSRLDSRFLSKVVSDVHGFAAYALKKTGTYYDIETECPRDIARKKLNCLQAPTETYRHLLVSATCCYTKISTPVDSGKRTYAMAHSIFPDEKNKHHLQRSHHGKLGGSVVEANQPAQTKFH